MIHAYTETSMNRARRTAHGGVDWPITMLIAGEDAVSRNRLRGKIPWRALGVDELHVADDADSLKALLDTLAVNIVLLDSDMPPIEGVLPCTWVHARRPDCRLILYGEHRDVTRLQAAIEASVCGYLPKPVSMVALEPILLRTVQTCRRDANEAGCVLAGVLLARLSEAMTGSREDVLTSLKQTYDTLARRQAVAVTTLRQIYFLLGYQIALREAKSELSDAFAYQLFASLLPLQSLDALHADLLARVDRVYPADEGSAGYSSAVRDVIGHIGHELCNEKLSIELLANRVYLTPTYLACIFKRETGMTIGQYILDRRMEYAQTLLRDRRFKLYQVAQSVGYRDANYFTRIFKKKAGMTPSEFRTREMQQCACCKHSVSTTENL